MRNRCFTLAALAMTLATGCVSKGDTNIERNSDADVPATCNSVCDRLQAQTFGDCKKWTDYDDCVAVCADHQPITEALECLETVTDCTEFHACDSKYDIF